MKKENVFYVYLVFLLLSLIGNSAADFAFLWLGASLLDAEKLGIDVVTGFYIGQAIGYIFLAPYLSSFATNLSKKRLAILVDSIYVMVYFLILLLYKFDLLSFSVMVFLSILMAGLSSVHKNAVTFSLLNQLSSKISISQLTEKFTYVFNFTLLFGSALSGLIFKFYGFYGCINFAIITFVPMLFIYFIVFHDEDSKNIENYKVVGSVERIKNGFKTLRENNNLFYSSIATSLAYIPGAIYPGLLAFYGKSKDIPDDIVAYGVSFGILIGTISIPFVTRSVSNKKYNVLLSLAFIPTVFSLVVCLIFNNFYLFSLSFGLNCIGFTILNITTIMLRVKTVESTKIASLNTTYYAVMCIGQVAGTLLLLPVISKFPMESILIMIVSFLLSAIVFYKKCNNKLVEDLIGAKVA